jgi:hypothetical protein
MQELRRTFNRTSMDTLEGEMLLDVDAQDIWGYNNRPEAGVYSKLAAARPGMFGQITARAAQQVLRLSLVYAMLDRAHRIQRQHLEAALEVWRYCEESCRFLFGDLIGDPTADTILKELRARPFGMTRSEIGRDLFQRNKAANEIDRGLNVLLEASRVRFEMEETGGKREAQRWFAL